MSNHLSVDSFSSLSPVVVDMVDLIVVTEALLLDSWEEIVGTKVMAVAANGVLRSMELEVSGFVYFFKVYWLSAIRGHSTVESNTVTSTVLAFMTAHVNFLWWFFFTEVLLIESVNLHSPFVSEWLTSVLFINMLRLGKESRSLLPSHCLSR